MSGLVWITPYPLADRRDHLRGLQVMMLRRKPGGSKVNDQDKASGLRTMQPQRTIGGVRTSDLWHSILTTFQVVLLLATPTRKLNLQPMVISQEIAAVHDREAVDE